MEYDLIIVGGGPAGLTAGIYASRYNLKTLILAKDLGMAASAGEIENFPGIYPVTGLELVRRMVEQAKSLGAEIKYEQVEKIEKKELFEIKTSKGIYKSKTLIYAAGRVKNELNVPGEKELLGKGVSYCATCDAAFFKDKVVAVIGGSNSALSAALLLSQFSKKIYIIYRGDEFFRPFPDLVKKIDENKKIEVLFNTEVKEIRGKDFVEEVLVVSKGKDKTLRVQGIFIEIGFRPNVELVEHLVELDESRRIKVDKGMRTSLRGFFAAGDVTDAHGNFDQIIVACSEGAIAASSAYRFLG